MPSFPNDVLDPAWCHGDLLVQACADDPAAARAAADDLAGIDGVRPRWRIDGFRRENTLTADGKPTTRDLLGFREGAGNPDPGRETVMDELVWVAPGTGEPGWATGGTYQVVRLIRFAVAVWRAEPLARQEAMIGRRESDGAPLGHDTEDAPFTYDADPDGHVIPLDAHIRRANPRTPETADNRILRRGYSYRDAGDDGGAGHPDPGHAGTGNSGGDSRPGAGRPDEGLVFVCFQQDLDRGFATVQRRLAGEALDKYVLPFGGGYFFVPPRPTGAPGDYLGRALVDG